MTQAIIKPSDRKNQEFPGAHRAAQLTKLMGATGARLRMDKFRESMGPNHFDYMLTDKMGARLSRGYRIWPSEWQKLVTIGKPDDLLDNYVEKVAPFANLDDLASTGGVFEEIDTPPDLEISYSCSGWGNLMVADFKTLRTDRLGWFGKISEEAGKAATRTFHKWLFYTMLQQAPNCADGNTLFHASHNNDASGAAVVSMTYANLKTTWDKMRAQTDENGEPIYIKPAYIICGDDNEVTAETLMNSKYNPDTANYEDNFFKGRVKDVIVSPYLGDDWYLWADPAMIEVMEVGFLDGNVDPAIFMLNPDVSDTYFRTKKTMWRVEHYYGGQWLDWRGICRGSTAT